ncbi:MAG: hypothetical protein U0821_14730 [Chloroflexota bacterium]
MLTDVSALTAWEVRGDLTCILCTRAIATAQGPKDRVLEAGSIKLRNPAHVDAVRKMRCPYCSGRLWLQDTEDVWVDRRPLSAEDLRPRRGRPPKIARAS